jgi:NAD(P)-dependent dehydrogenase (short-subunit alcohol dehydrogenase family)
MQTVLITGAATGIGRASALRMAQAGWTVFAGVRKQADGESLQAAGGEQIVPLILDVTDGEQIADVVAQIGERVGDRGLDGLVNNAGIGVAGPLELIPIDDLRRQFEVNVFGLMAITQALLPRLRSARGRLVLISSVGGRVTTPFTGPYCASKYAVEALGDALRVELRRSNIQVALIEPGSIDTPIWDKADADLQAVEIPSELQEQYGRVPAAMAKTIKDTAKRGIAPEKVAEQIAHALTAGRPRTRYVVGRDARMMMLGRSLMPDRVFDALVTRVLGV